MVLLNMVFGDIHAKDPWIYWRVWIVGLVVLVSKWYDRNRRDKMKRLIAQWRKQQVEARLLDAEIETNLTQLGFPSGQEDGQ